MSKLHVSIKRIDPSLPLPEYQTSGAVAFDLYSRETVTIAPRSIYRIPTNFVIQVPDGYMLYIKDRSSTAKKKGLLPTAGIIDRDYCGPNDEILFQVYNVTDQEVVVERGERIAQGMFVRVDTADWHEVQEMDQPDRGGFGSTGTHV
jgi:dUTP pyrophosphatase